MPSFSLVLASLFVAASVQAAPNVHHTNHFKRSDPTCASQYNSVQGDTCNSIGEKFGVTGGEILTANKFLDCWNIWENTPVCVPAPSTCVERYTSVEGDNCGIIEDRYHLTHGTLVQANDFVNCDDIWVGTPLCIPAGPYKACKDIYVSQPGDSCDSVDAAYNLQPGTVLASNTFLQCTDIWTWTPICVPDGPYNSGGGTESDIASVPPTATNTGADPSVTCSTYTVQPEDVCDDIATSNNVSVVDLEAANPTSDCQSLQAGEILLICPPGATVPNLNAQATSY